MTRVMVTGGAGFVGANLARRLVRDGHDVHVLARPAGFTWRLDDVRTGLRIHHTDLRDGDAVVDVVRAVRPEWVFHLAAYGAYPSQRSWTDMVGVNVTGTANLVQACLTAGVEAIVNTGTSSEYGYQDHPAREADRLEPNSEYAVTKAAATMYCRHVARTTDVHIPTLRLYSAYGPYEEPSRLIPALLVRGLAGSYPPLANPRIARDFVYVDDVVDAYLLAVKATDQDRGEIYNVGTGRQTSLEAVVAAVRSLLSIAREPEWGTMAARTWDTTTWVADTRKIGRALGWSATTPLETGLRSTATWLQANPTLHARYGYDLAGRRAQPVGDSG